MTAPQAPGSLTTPAQPSQMLTYLADLGTWIAEARAALDRIDKASLDAQQAASATRPAPPGARIAPGTAPLGALPAPATALGPSPSDIAIALAAWNAVQQRYSQMMTVWDSGRVGPTQLRQLSELIWGRLGDPGDGVRTLALNIPEACRLTDALTAQLNADLRLTDESRESALRIRALLAGIDRLRDQVQLEPVERRAALTATVDKLAHDTDELVAREQRGGDIGGYLGPLETTTATMERDLIVGNAKRREAAERRTQTQAAVDRLAARERDVAALVDKTARTVAPAPKYAVPHVAALGPVPETTAEIDAYAARLARVAQALDYVEQANNQALATKGSLDADLARLTSRLAAAPNPTATALLAQARDLAAQEPAPIDVIRPLLTACEAAIGEET